MLKHIPIFQSVLILIVLTLILGSTPMRSQEITIFTLWGNVDIPGFGAPADGTVDFDCYVIPNSGSPGDTLHHDILTNNYYTSGYYIVQAPELDTPLYENMTLHIDLWESDGGGSASGEILMPLEPSVQLDLSILNSSLSVELHSFSAVPGPGGIAVRWSTQSEVNNLGFILERRCPDTGWETIASYLTSASLRGQGNASSRTDYLYLDVTAKADILYRYRLSDVNTSGKINILDIVEIEISRTESPAITTLEPPSPNPFNPTTQINYQLSESVPVDITVYNLSGKPVRILVHEMQSSGTYHVYWHGTDRNGIPAPSGSYFLVLKTPETIRTQKALLMR